MKLVLASKSPRRKEILSNAGLEFIIANSDYEEELDSREFSYTKIENLAYGKALGTLKNVHEPSFIISADTVVVLDNIILTKPVNFDDALNILESLNGKTHKVVTSICIIDSQTKNYILKSTTTKVEFNQLSKEKIINYITQFKPYDKAGAYGIQELPTEFIKKVDGDLENVIGISSIATKTAINELKLLLEGKQERFSYPQD